MIELIFVIIIMGILAAVAIPRLAVTRTDAIITRVKTQIGSIRNAITINKSLNLLKGNAAYPLYLDDAQINQTDEELFDGNGSIKILDYPIISSNKSGGWMKIGNNKYRVKIDDANSVNFIYNNSNGHFDCEDKTVKYCDELTQ